MSLLDPFVKQFRNNFAVPEPSAERDPVLRSLVRGFQERSVKANADPLDVVDQQMSGVSPGREFLANFLQGFSASMNERPFVSVRERLLEREIARQQIAQKQQDSALLRIQQLTGQQSREAQTAQRVGGQIESTKIRALMSKYSVDAGVATALANIESREFIAEQNNQVKREQLDVTKDYREWQKDHGDALVQVANRRVAAMEKRNDALGREDGSYQAQSPEGQVLQQIARIGNTGETKTKSAAAQLLKEMNYISENIDNATTPEEREMWVEAGRQKVLVMAPQGLAGQAQKDGFQFRLKTLDALNRAEQLMSQLEDQGNLDKLGFFTGTIEEWKRRYSGDDADTTLAQLHRVLQGHFFDFRQNMSGAAFSEAESRSYESISPTTNKTFNLNVALMKEMREESIRALINELQKQGPQALELFLDEDGLFTYNGRKYIVQQ